MSLPTYYNSLDKVAGDGGLHYTNTNKTTATVGGVPKGTTFEYMRLVDVLDMILYPYVATTISSLTITPTVSLKEYGTSTTYTKAVTVIKRGAVTISNVSLYLDTTLIASASSTDIDNFNNLDLDDTKTFTFEFSLKTDKEDIDKAFKIVVTEDACLTYPSGTTISKSGTKMTYAYPIYYGAVSSSTTSLSSSDVTSLTKSLVAKASSYSYSFTTSNQKMVFAYPASYGELKSTGGILDPNNFDMSTSFTHTTVSVSSTDGYWSNISYYVYLQNNSATNSGFKMTFTF